MTSAEIRRSARYARLEEHDKYEAEDAYKILLHYEKEIKGFKQTARKDSIDGSKGARPLSWPVTLLYIAKNIIEEAGKIAYWRERNNREYPGLYTPELIDEIEKDRKNLQEARKRIEEYFTRWTF